MSVILASLLAVTSCRCNATLCLTLLRPTRSRLTGVIFLSMVRQRQS